MPASIAIVEPSEVISSTGTRYRVQRDPYGFTVVCQDGSFGHTSDDTFDADQWERRFEAFRRDPVWEYARQRERELRALKGDVDDVTADIPRQGEHEQTLQKGLVAQAGN